MANALWTVFPIVFYVRDYFVRNVWMDTSCKGTLIPMHVLLAIQHVKPAMDQITTSA